MLQKLTRGAAGSLREAPEPRCRLAKTRYDRKVWVVEVRVLTGTGIECRVKETPKPKEASGGKLGHS